MSVRDPRNAIQPGRQRRTAECHPRTAARFGRDIRQNHRPGKRHTAGSTICPWYAFPVSHRWPSRHQPCLRNRLRVSRKSPSATRTATRARTPVTARHLSQMSYLHKDVSQLPIHPFLLFFFCPVHSPGGFPTGGRLPCSRPYRGKALGDAKPPSRTAGCPRTPPARHATGAPARRRAHARVAVTVQRRRQRAAGPDRSRPRLLTR